MGIRNLIDRSRGAFGDALARICLSTSPDSPPLRRPLDLAQLEDRIMLSASPVGDLLMPVEPAPEAAGELVAIAAPPSTTDQTAPGTPDPSAWRVETQVELVFVDQGVQDYEQLVVDLLRDADPVRHFEVILLDENRDGVEQISEVLQEYTDLSAIHLVSHGTAGRVNLGNLWLTDLNIDAHAGQIAAWNSSLRDGADILIYGCDLASNEAGRTLTAALGALCDCDVAASDDQTGHVDRGGDWEFEHQVGQIEAEVAFSFGLQQSWTSTLAIETFQQGVSGYTATQDTYLDPGSPSTSFGGADDLTVESGNEQTLIRFDQILDDDSGPVPKNSVINSATLTVKVSGTNGGSNISIHQMLTGWTESSTWNSLTGGVQLGSEAATVADDSVNGGSSTADFDVTSSVQNWSFSPTNTNLGWVVLSDSSGDWKGTSSEKGTVGDRPLLTIDYTLIDLFVTNNLDVVNGDTSDVTALLGDDGGDGISLREAIQAANGTTGLTNVGFDLSGSNTISLGSALDNITESIGLYAVSDPDRIVIDGGNNGFDGFSLDSSANNSTIAGFNIRNMGAGNGLKILSSNNSIVDNFIGTDETGNAASGATDNSYGIWIESGIGNTIGGPLAQDMNVIAGNSNAGIYLKGTSGNTIHGNHIGVGLNGTASLGNANGIHLESASNTTIGGASTSDRNVISGNSNYGIWIDSGSANSLENNYIGTNAAGTAAVANWLGVYVDGSNGNLIGDHGDGNLISGNTQSGVKITGGASNNEVQANYIGTNASGNSDIANGTWGVLIEFGAQFNVIGTDGDGSNDGNEGNVISGNGWAGVATISSDDNTIAGNYIGLTATGSSTLGNSGDGVYLFNSSRTRIGTNDDGISDGAERNVISSNGDTLDFDYGIEINGGSSFSITIAGNYIGTNASGSGGAIFGNFDNGIYLHNGAYQNTIGGITSDLANRIVNSGSAGISLATDAGIENALLGNLIYSNTGLGIDLQDDDAVEANDGGGADDGDSGANNLQNFPQITNVVANAGGTSVTVDFDVDSLTSTTFRVEFFKTSDANPAHGEGEAYLGFKEVTTDGSGFVSSSHTMAGVSLGAGDYFTATATEKSGASLLSTSEFSQNLVAEFTPQISVNGTRTFTEGLGSIFVDGTATVTDLDSPDFSGGQLVIEIDDANGTTNDRLAINDEGSGPGNIHLTGPNNIHYNGNATPFATYTGGSSDTDPLVISLINSNATQAAVERLIENITFENVSDTPSTANRTVQFTLTDGDNNTSVTDTVTVQVQATNDDPTNTGSFPGTDLAAVEETATNVDLSAIVLDDIDAGGGSLTVKLQTALGGQVTASSGAGITVGGSPTNRTLSGSLGNLNAYLGDPTKIQFTGGLDVFGNDVDSITVKVNDNNNTGSGGGLDLTLGTLSVDISGVNDDPINIVPGPQNVITGVPKSFDVANGNLISISDVDAGVLPLEVTLNGTNGTISLSGITGLSFTTGDGTDDATMTFTGTLANINAALDGLTFTGTTVGAASLQMITDDQGNTGTPGPLVDDDTIAITVANGMILDQFNAPAYNGNDGTVNWVGSWVELDEADGPALGRVRVESNSLHIFGNGGSPFEGAHRIADLSGATTALLSFDYNLVQGWSSRFRVQVSTDGVLWSDPTLIYDSDYRGSESGSVTNYDISAFISSTTHVRFWQDEFGDDADHIFFDNIQIEYSGFANTPPTINSDGGGPTAGINVAENTTAVTTVTATDPEAPPQVLSYSITGGADAAKFSIVGGTGVLTFDTAPDFETPTDTDTDNVYEVQVTVDDGNGGTDVQLISVTVTDANDAPVITSSSSPSVAENQTAVLTVTTTDEDLPADTISYTITGGGDSGAFLLNATTGVLTFSAAPDFETPTDADTNNVYEVQVTADDGNGGADVQLISVTVTDVNDAPVITSSGTPSVAENQTAVLTMTTTDEDLPADTISYTITGGGDSGAFSLNATSGVLTFIAAPDVETPTDADTNNVYEVQVTADDGNGSTDVQLISVTVTDANDAPVITSSSTPSAAENQTAVLTVTTTDEDLPADTITYTITGGADSGAFTLNATTGVLAFTATPDFESPTDADTNNVYVVQVTADDGNGGTDVQLISVTVTDANDAPLITSSSTPSAAENQTTVLTVTTTDQDIPADTITYTITGGADSVAFTLNATTGVLTFTAAPDFESPSDADTNNVYEVQVTADDGNGGTDLQLISVTVTDANDTPLITSSSTPSAAENQTTVLTVTTTDEDLPADTITYTISGGADGGLFSLNATSGVLTFTASPDFEIPSDADTNNVYEVQVTADDGNGGSDVQLISVTVTDANDAPVITSSSTPSVAENQFSVVTITTTDEDLPADTITYTISGGADGGLFSLNATSGVLTFTVAPDFETPGDADTNNVYEVQVTAADGNGGSDVQSVSVTVIDVAAEGPGGVGANLNLWLDAGSGVTTGAGGVSQWDNLVSNATLPDIQQGTISKRPDLNSAALNFNPVISFDGANDGLGDNSVLGTDLFAADAVSIFTVVRVNGPGVVAQWTGGADNRVNIEDASPRFEFGSEQPAYRLYGSGMTNEYHIVNARAVPGSPVNMQIFVDGQLDVQSDAVSASPLNPAVLGQFAVGQWAAGESAFADMDLAEVLIYDTELNVGDQHKVESYLAVKYGVTLDQGTPTDYVDSSGSVIWDAAINASFDNDIAGFGQDNASSLNQPQSRSSNSDAILTVSAASSQDDGEFLLWGNDDGALTETSLGNPSNVTQRLQRIWRVDETGELGTTALAFDVSGIPVTGTVASDFTLLIDSDADFSSGATLVTASSYVGGVATFTAVNLADGQLFALGTDDNTAPTITSDGGGATAALNVAENTTTVTTVTATDPEAPPQTLTYSIAGGADAASFNIDIGTGALTLVTAPDFENPTDAGLNNVYDVTVQIDDGNGGTDTQDIAVTVDPVNDNSPVVTSANTQSINENVTVVHTLTATDADLPTQSISFSVAGTGVDDALFTVNGSNQLVFLAAPDFEMPLDAGADNTYNVDVEADDGNGGLTTQSISVTVDPVNDNSPVFTTPAATNVNENTTFVQTVIATDADLPAQTVTYSISGGADAAYFTINGVTGNLSFLAAPDFETPLDAGADNVYEVEVTADDNVGNTTPQLISVTVDPVNNNSPVFTTPAATNVNENTTFVQTVIATDADLPAQTVTYSISGGADAGFFTINGATGDLAFLTAPDFETPLDTGADNVYEVEVTADDNVGNTTPQSISVTVDPVNDHSPVFTTPAATNVNENTTFVQTVIATDADLPGQTVTYSLSGGADAAFFTINGVTGDLAFLTAPDFETPLDTGADNVYEVEVTADDNVGNTTPQLISVTVDPVNNNSPVFTTPAATNVNENTTFVQTVLATDADLPAQTVTYSLSGGADAGFFTINGATGDLAFLTAPDFETPLDTGADNVYEVEVTADDNVGNTTPQSISVTVDPVNDHSPVFTTPAATNVNENTTFVQTVIATDADLPAQTVTYSISGGADAGFFTINGATGDLGFLTAPDFETPLDTGADNVYEVEVTADDNVGNTTPQSISVTVDPVNDHSPVFTTPAATNVNENTTFVQTVIATDADLPGQTVTYSLSGGADAAFFTINGVTGDLAFLAAPDFESPADANIDNVYEVDITADDGNGGTAVQAISVTVTGVNEAPLITSSSSPGVAENQTSVVTITSTDPDVPADTMTYTISGGADAGSFTLDAATGVLAFSAVPDFEAPADADGNNIYEVQVTANDGNGGSDVQVISVTVTDANETPLIISAAAYVVTENTTSVGTVTAMDPDGNPLVFSISGGSDGGEFTINASTGALSFVTAPNFEVPGDADADNVYQVDVTVADGNGGAATQAMSVTVTDANDAPISTNASYTMDGDSVLNVTAAGVLTGDGDEDGDPLNAVLVVGPALGTLALDADGSFTFTPPTGFDGTVQFSYAANDGTTNGNVATVTIVVDGVVVAPPPPAAEPPAEAPEEKEETPDEVVPPPVASTPPAPPPPASEPTSPVSSEPSAEAAQTGPIVEQSEVDLSGLDHVPYTDAGDEPTSKKLSTTIRQVTSQVAESLGDGLAFVLDAVVWQDLDELKNHVDSRNATAPIVAGTTAGVSTVVTAGYVLWTIRGGWLVGSLLAQMPAWQLVDPLLILDSLNEEDLLDDEHREEDKKVEEMFEESAYAK